MTILPVAHRRQEVGGHKQPLLDLGDGLVDGLSDIVDVLGGQTAHVDATAGHQVHVLLFDHELHLFGCKTHDNTPTVTQSPGSDASCFVTRWVFFHNNLHRRFSNLLFSEIINYI